MDALVSVIVPIYNVEKYLRQCLESICCQTYSNIEIILVDDGSSDHCYEIYNDFRQRDNRIRVIRQENRGLSAARNVGLEASRGDYVIFIDSDDYVDPHLIEKLLIAISISDADFSFCNYTFVDEDGSVLKVASDFPDEDHFIGKELLEKICLGDYNWFWSVVWNRLYKREFIMRFRFAEGKIHEDEFHLHEVLLSAPKMQPVREALYYYRLRSNSIMQKKYNLRNYDRVEALLYRAEAMHRSDCMNYVVMTVLRDALGEMKKGYEILDYSARNVKRRYAYLLRKYRKIVIHYIIPAKNIQLCDKAYFLLNATSPYHIWKLKRGRR